MRSISVEIGMFRNRKINLIGTKGIRVNTTVRSGILGKCISLRMVKAPCRPDQQMPLKRKAPKESRTLALLDNDIILSCSSARRTLNLEADERRE